MRHKIRRHFNIKNDALILTPSVISLKDIDPEKDVYLEFVNQLNNNLESGSGIIVINVDSYGGNVYTALGIIDAIENCPIPVATVCQSKAFSGGALIFLCGKTRFIGKRATLMIHDVSSFAFGKNPDIQADANETSRLSNEVWAIVKTYSNLTEKTLGEKLEKLKYADWYLTATDCIELNMADKIGLPILQTEITFKTALVEGAHIE